MVNQFPDIQLVSAKNLWNNNGAPNLSKLAVKPKEGCHALLYLASGATGGEMRLYDGTVPFAAPNDKSVGFVIFVPNGAELALDVVPKCTEGYCFALKCQGLKRNLPRERLAIKSEGGESIAFNFSARLSFYETTILRPFAERAYNYFHEKAGKGSRLGALCCLMALFESLLESSNRQKFSEDPVARLWKAIETKPQGVKIAEAANAANFSPGGLSRRFKKEKGISPTEFKHRQTIHFARFYIANSSLPFSKIARKLGFQSASYFTQFIEKHLGKSPSELRFASKER